MSVDVRFQDLVEWLAPQVPKPCAEPLAALLAQHGKHLKSHPKREVALRDALVKYLSRFGADRPDDDFDELLDSVELLLQPLQNRLGDVWPIQLDPDGLVTSIVLEPGIGKRDGRAITTGALLSVLAVLIVAAESKSESAAAACVLDVLLQLGLTSAESVPAMSIGRNKKLVVEHVKRPLGARSPEVHWDTYAEPALDPSAVLEAYLKLASELGPAASVTLPRIPPGLHQPTKSDSG